MIALMIIVFAIAILFCLSQIGRILLAMKTLEDIEKLWNSGVITTVQAGVFLQELDNPYDTAAVLDVRKQLQYIVEKELRQIEINKSTDR